MNKRVKFATANFKSTLNIIYHYMKISQVNDLLGISVDESAERLVLATAKCHRISHDRQNRFNPIFSLYFYERY